MDIFFKSLGDQQLTELASVQSLTIPIGTILVLIQAEAADIRLRFNGELPTASVGFLLRAGESLFFDGDASGIRLIQAASGAIANVFYFDRRL